MKISSSFWRFPGSEWESATLSPNFHFFFICNFIFFSFSFVFDGFPLFFIVFHGFPGFQVPRARKMKKKEKKWKKIKKWKFPRVFEDFLVRSENLQLWVQIFIFFHLQLHFFFIFLCFWWFSIVFHCFSWLSWISGATGKENEKTMNKNKKKWKFSSSFWRFPGSEWESATLSPNFHFFYFPLFLMVFHCFSLFFMAFLDFRCHGQGKWKKNEKKWKKWKFPRVFEDFLVRSENLQLWVQIFIFFSFATSFFFHFPLFLMVSNCFSLFFMVFLDFRCHGKGKWKKKD